MPGLIAVLLVLLLAGLAALFVMNARLIRRDLDDRYGRVRARLEEDANTVIRPLLDRHRDA
jgi:hypothetical protein